MKNEERGTRDAMASPPRFLSTAPAVTVRSSEPQAERLHTHTGGLRRKGSLYVPACSPPEGARRRLVPYELRYLLCARSRFLYMSHT